METVTAADTFAKCDACTPVSSYLRSTQLFVALPLTSATVERPVSATRRLNSELLSEKHDGRSASPRFGPYEHYHDLPIDPEKGVDKLAKKKRRLNFIL